MFACELLKALSLPGGICHSPTQHTALANELTSPNCQPRSIGVAVTIHVLAHPVAAAEKLGQARCGRHKKRALQWMGCSLKSCNTKPINEPVQELHWFGITGFNNSVSKRGKGSTMRNQKRKERARQLAFLTAIQACRQEQGGMG